MGRYRKVIFVCMDNTCRSIMAEAVMNSVNKQHMVCLLYTSDAADEL